MLHYGVSISPGVGRAAVRGWVWRCGAEHAGDSPLPPVAPAAVTPLPTAPQASQELSSCLGCCVSPRLPVARVGCTCPTPHN